MELLGAGVSGSHLTCSEQVIVRPEAALICSEQVVALPRASLIGSEQVVAERICTCAPAITLQSRQY